MDYIEVNFNILPVEPWRDLLNSDLGEIGFESFVETAYGTQAFIREDEFSETAVNGIIENYGESCKVSYNFIKIKSENWNQKWEANFDPIIVDEKCVVKASFHDIKPYPIEIVIDPKMSFGTGHHATTYLMIKQMLGMDFHRHNVLDMGCGTSVLAILASKSGAKSVLAIDFDEWAYENSLENVKNNGVSNIEVSRGSNELLEGKQFNTILANINLNVLFQQLPSYINALSGGGEILLSGILFTDVAKMKQELIGKGVIVKEINQRDKWALIHCAKA